MSDKEEEEEELVHFRCGTRSNEAKQKEETLMALNNNNPSALDGKKTTDFFSRSISSLVYCKFVFGLPFNPASG